MTDHPPSPWARIDYRQELEYARFSRVAYLDEDLVANAGAQGNPDYEHLLGERPGIYRWEFVKSQNLNETTGFVAHVFMQERPDKRILIAIRGSDNLADWSGPNMAVARDSDLLDMLALPAPATARTRAQMAKVQEALLPGEAWDAQFRDALEFARGIRDGYGAQGYTILVSGHSGGGAQAQVISHTFGWDGRSFDAPGAANIVRSQGYRQWLSEHDVHPAGTPAFRRGPADSGFLNYKVNNSAVADHTGPHLGEAQSISSYHGREGFGSHARYVAGIVGGGIGETPLLGPVLKAAGAARVATVVGRAAHGAQHGIDAPDRHDIDRVVAVFEEAVRRQDRGERQPLPIFGGQDARTAVPLAAAMPAEPAAAATIDATPARPGAGPLPAVAADAALDRFLQAAACGDADAFARAARDLCATPAAAAWLQAGREQLKIEAQLGADLAESALDAAVARTALADPAAPTWVR